MNIGEFARYAGVSPSKVRFYETQGLIGSSRRDNGYRSYGQEDLERFFRVKRAKALGFSLEQIARFLSLSDVDRKAKLGVVEAAEEKLAEIDQRLFEVRKQREQMLAFLVEVRADKRNNIEEGGG